MYFLSRRSVLAIVSVIDIAITGRTEPVQARHLAERLDLPPRHLETVLQALVRSGILKGYRGPRGGYEIARERRRLSAGEIVRAILRSGEEDEDEKESAKNSKYRKSPLVHIVSPAVNEACEAFLTYLDTLSLDSFCQEAERQGVFDNLKVEADFDI
jgi:Rrf2 family transcriptional regulator, iron-sulfur cluster assembly transcription factor